MKIAIIGYSGSGKSTLAKALGELYNCKALFLDAVNFTSNWEERDTGEAVRLVEDFLDREDAWVIDGNYQRFLQERRLEEADRIIFMDFGRFTCFRRAWSRYRRYRGKTRESMAEGCDEKFDGEFIRWILWEGRTPKHRAHYANIVKRYSQKTVVLKDQRQLDAFLEETAQKCGH